MKYQNLLLLIICTLFTSCAVLDTSMLDTAEPLVKGQPKVQLYFASSPEVNSMVYYKQVDSTHTNRIYQGYKEAKSGQVTGIKIAFGVGYGAELGIKSWGNEEKYSGVKVFAKKLLYKQDKVLISTIPAYIQMKHHSSSLHINLFRKSRYGYITDYYDNSYKIRGFELPLLLTCKFDNDRSITLQAHYNHEKFSLRNPDMPRNSFSVNHYGFKSGYQTGNKVVGINIEAGVECIPVVNGSFCIIPTYAVGWSLKLPEK